MYKNKFQIWFGRINLENIIEILGLIRSRLFIFLILALMIDFIEASTFYKLSFVYFILVVTVYSAKS